MLKSNKVNLILALIVAIVLWAYVLVDVNQSSTETVKGVPIKILNEDILEQNNLVLLSADYEKVNISYSCQRAFLGKIKESEFSVTADVEGLKKGTHKIKLYITSPDDVTVENVNIPKITVVIDELVTVDKPVIPVIDNLDSDDTEPNILQLSDDVISVKGAKSLVDRVVSMNAVLDASKVGNEMKSFTIPLTAVDKNGDAVVNITPAKDNVSITAVLLQKKTVPLEVPVDGINSGDFEHTVSIPRTITIKGSDSVLAGIDRITCDRVDLSSVYEDTKIKLNPILPLGVNVATESQNLYIKVTVKGVETKSFTFDENDIEVRGVTENASAIVEDVKVKVTVTAKSGEIDDITEADFLLTADVEGLEAGSHKVNLVCTCSKSHTDMEYTPGEINITISENKEDNKR